MRRANLWQKLNMLLRALHSLVNVRVLLRSQVMLWLAKEDRQKLLLRSLKEAYQL